MKGKPCVYVTKSYTPKTWEFGVGFGIPCLEYGFDTYEAWLLFGPITLTIHFQSGKENTDA